MHNAFQCIGPFSDVAQRVGIFMDTCRYTTSLHWSLTQFTPAAMEIHPHNYRERMYTIVVLLFSLVMFSSFISSITQAMTNLRNLNAERARQSEYIRRYITANRVSLELGNRIYSFLRKQGYMHKKRLHESDVAVIKSLPQSLLVDLRAEVYLPHLLPHPLFHHYSSCDSIGLVNICHYAMTEIHLGYGERLFDFGDTAEGMFFVVSGDLDYFLGTSETDAVVLCTGDYVSEGVLWVRWEHLGRLVAEVPCELVRLNAAKFRSVTHRMDAYESCKSYAQAYRTWILRLETQYGEGVDVLSDIWGDFDATQEMAQNAFESMMEEDTGYTAMLRKKMESTLSSLSGGATDSRGRKFRPPCCSWAFHPRRRRKKIASFL
eukprot:gnl/TRDRNA2_/TRDRNA2_168235_c4_seq4.p1 gnl/TRDRNA2_/TRDRNA2_168235_c4~~gnl/TRDRNA2_/TRDRNA2_168235_c4_seq4.p1  ORF type:complete len:376 (+),score=31.41 gnl/TRDRNA2_/TRDRNA2_168235_c4_seq4:45-1172(+)